MRLLFDQTKVPRSTTRQAWKAMSRQVRQQHKICANGEAQMLEILRRPTTPASLRSQIMDELINPPLLFGPYQ